MMNERRRSVALGITALFAVLSGRIEVTKSIAGAGLKITPDIMVGGGGADGSGNIFSAFIAQLLAGNRLAIEPPPNGDGQGRQGQ